jgi:predicted permease
VTGDVRYAAGQLRMHATFTLVTLFTLALGAGLNTAVFSVVNAVLLRPMPFRSPDAVVVLRVRNPAGRLGEASLQDYHDWRRETADFADMGAYATRGGTLASATDPLKVQHALVTPSLLRTLGIQPAVGRLFNDDEDLPGADGVALISDGLWREAFGRRGDILGARLDLNGTTMRIVGVMPPAFVFPDPDIKLWKPFGMRPEDGGARDGRWVRVVARLRDGVTVTHARGDFDRVVKDLGRRYPETNAGLTAAVTPLLETIVGSSRPMLLLLTVAVAFVLTIAAANVANLLIARNGARGRSDIALRLALGASRWRVARPILVESLMLSAAGSMAGLAMAAWAAPVLASLSHGSLPRSETVAIDSTVLVFTLTVMALTSVAVALLPALKTATENPAHLLHASGRTIPSRSRVRRALVLIEVALAFAAVVAGGVVVRSFERASAVNPGFETTGMLTLRIEPPWRASPERAANREAFGRQHAAERESMAMFYEALLHRLRALPGVTAAAAINRRPLSGRWWGTEFRTDVPVGPAARSPRGLVRVVTGGYFEAMRVPVRSGRTIRATDDAHAVRVVVVSEALARQAWPDAGAIGRRLSLPGGSMYEVVGVVGDVKPGRPDGDDEPVAYFSFAQAPWGHFGDWGMDIVVRAPADPIRLAGPVRTEVRAAAPALPVLGMMAMEDAFALGLADRRFSALLFGAFGALAVALSMVGLGGVLVMMVNERRGEIGVRTALGATPVNIALMVIREAARLTTAGLGIGVLIAAGAAPAIQSLLFGVAAVDARTYLAAAALVVTVSLLSCVVPIIRAARLDPVGVLRTNA